MGIAAVMSKALYILRVHLETLFASLQLCLFRTPDLCYIRPITDASN